MNIATASFLKSARNIEQSPDLLLPEIAVIGRSNVGKSSLINFLTNHKGLAKSSSVPGKTQLINFFLINDQWMLVDFPGYGYAKKSKLHRTERVDTMQEYLTQKATIKDTLLLINAHLPPQSVDMIMLELLSDASIPYTIVFTKTDKASQKVINTNINQCKQFLQSLKVPLPTMIMTSSYKKHGLEKLGEHIQKKLITCK